MRADTRKYSHEIELDTCKRINAEMLRALKRAAPWLGKMIADGGHNNSVLPKDCERTLEMVEAAIQKAEAA